ncbi:unnamed protein product (macronuclear) [Paramecium tetraurelia]|uniref:Uncharacterized protein n=1 Tax=Paramecium tetraurelia TaxID=5888 RepID=A0DMV7_PARTE|nr:uncharacterized protein GSPATT00018578001 [Paramecium tetraurelia]CAK84374.1 unnamed protein product [Paramecium tetraurelia]|eukprot:XP_001451771.1 hypothetical protein (macronuclear) [Paramecium tetraurelia strain d4-2]
MAIESEVLYALYELYKRSLISYEQKGMIKGNFKNQKVEICQQAKILCCYLLQENVIVSLVYRIRFWNCQEVKSLVQIFRIGITSLYDNHKPSEKNFAFLNQQTEIQKPYLKLQQK